VPEPVGIELEWRLLPVALRRPEVTPRDESRFAWNESRFAPNESRFGSGEAGAFRFRQQSPLG